MNTTIIKNRRLKGKYFKGGNEMEMIISFGFIALVISCITIEVKVRKLSEQNKEIIELLKLIKEK